MNYSAAKRVSLLFILFTFVAVSGYASPRLLSPQEKKVSEGEAKSADAVQTAVGAAAKLAAATAFVTKHPKSSLRAKVAEHVGIEITNVTTAAEKMRLAEEMQKLFTAADEGVIVKRVMMDAYLSSERWDEGFGLAAAALTANPNDVWLLTRLTAASSEAAKRQNGKFVTAGLEHGAKAIAVIEGNQKPAGVEDAVWARNKEYLPRLYQDLGVLSLVSRNLPEARTRFEKAAQLAPTDPINFAMLASVIEQDYQDVATRYQGMPAGEEKEKLLKRANELMDEMIESYARTIGVAGTRPEYQPLSKQALENLTPYYKYRHNNSTDGMQALIDKYKTFSLTP